MLAALSLAFLAACTGTGGQESGGYHPEKPDTAGMRTTVLSYDEQNRVREEFDEVASSGSLTLYVNRLDGGLRVKAGTCIYQTAADTGLLGIGEVNEIWRYNINTLFTFGYYLTDQNKGVEIETTPVREQAQMRIRTGNNGVHITYWMPKLGLGITVEAQLLENSLSVRIPEDGIRETADARITTVRLLPFFGACAGTGYALLPDGPGMIARFDSPNQKGVDSRYSFSVFGEAQPAADRTSDQENAGVYLPVYGMNAGDHALFAAVTDGAADAQVEYSPAGYIVSANRTAPVFTYRYAVDMTQITGENTGRDESQKQTALRFEAALREKTAEVRYWFLDGEAATYSGMAGVYRTYLKESGQLPEREAAFTTCVDLFMGVYEEQILYDKYVAMTTYQQAEEIYRRLSEGGLGHLSSTLWGATKGGYGRLPDKPQAENKLGGEKAFRALAGTADSLGVSLSIQTDPLTLKTDNGGFSSKKDTIYTLANVPLLRVDTDGFYRNLPSAFTEYLPGFVAMAKETGMGLSVENLGDRLYLDNNRTGIQSRTESVMYVGEKLRETAGQVEDLRTGGNLYTLGAADAIIGLPYTSSRYDIEDETVPFYQMVVHGTLSYTGSPYNLSGDFVTTELKWAEYGYMPYFLLTAENARLLKYTEANWLYTSHEEKWLPRVLEVAGRMQQRLGALAGKAIIRHEKLADNVYRSTFAGGAQVTVNYAQTAYQSGDITVAARDYVVQQ